MHRVLAKDVTEKVCYSYFCNYSKFACKVSMNLIHFLLKKTTVT